MTTRSRVALLLGDSHANDAHVLRDWCDCPSGERLINLVAGGAGLPTAELLAERDPSNLVAADSVSLAVRLAMVQAVRSLTVEPIAVAGFGVGELAALAAFGAVPIPDAAALVAQRARVLAPRHHLSRAEVDQISHGDLIALCRRVRGAITIAEHRSASRHVVVGSEASLSAALQFAEQLGGETVAYGPAADGAGGACSIPALVSYRRLLRHVRFAPPTTSIVSSVSLGVLSPSEWPDALAHQLHSPALWSESASSLVFDDPAAVVYLDTDPLCLKLTAGLLRGAKALRVSVPSDVTVLGPVLQDDLPALDRLLPEGETIAMSERLVVSPLAGLYRPATRLWLDEHCTVDGRGLHVGVGDELGQVSDVPVHSTFDGTLMKMMAWSGERVRTGQPIVWLRAAS
jgi:[acyl-carrier-protein] S-malonyltransferase